ncbi:cycloartenol-C-24-methyltransferase 1-like [Curcuma longa]|uniref:cycloartenol-C-24-methyltransferase 1-like n=1 Tax=Curcuma longa TaxID=136217 RepID=UPI003D9FADE6
MTGHYNPNNEIHKKVKAEIEFGGGFSDVRTTRQCLDALKFAGFEVIWEKDLAADSPVPWYLPLDTSRFSITSFRLTAVGRFITRSMVKTLEFVGIAPTGSHRVSSFLEKAAEAIETGGRMEIFTPMYFFLVRKSLSDH